MQVLFETLTIISLNVINKSNTWVFMNDFICYCSNISV